MKHLKAFQHTVLSCLTERYIMFSGRAAYQEFRDFVLFVFLSGCILGALAQLLQFPANSPLFMGAVLICGLIISPPLLAVAIRRLHDIGVSGWYVLPLLIVPWAPIFYAVFMFFASESNLAIWFDYMWFWPLIICIVSPLAGKILWIYILAKPGTPGPNRFGPNPLDEQP